MIVPAVHHRVVLRLVHRLALVPRRRVRHRHRHRHRVHLALRLVARLAVLPVLPVLHLARLIKTYVRVIASGFG